MEFLPSIYVFFPKPPVIFLVLFRVTDCTQQTDCTQHVWSYTYFCACDHHVQKNYHVEKGIDTIIMYKKFLRFVPTSCTKSFSDPHQLYKISLAFSIHNYRCDHHVRFSDSYHHVHFSDLYQHLVQNSFSLPW